MEPPAPLSASHLSRIRAQRLSAQRPPLSPLSSFTASSFSPTIGGSASPILAPPPVARLVSRTIAATRLSPALGSPSLPSLPTFMHLNETGLPPLAAAQLAHARIEHLDPRSVLSTLPILEPLTAVGSEKKALPLGPLSSNNLASSRRRGLSPSSHSRNSHSGKVGSAFGRKRLSRLPIPSFDGDENKPVETGKENVPPPPPPPSGLLPSLPLDERSTGSVDITSTYLPASSLLPSPVLADTPPRPRSFPISSERDDAHALFDEAFPSPFLPSSSSASSLQPPSPGTKKRLRQVHHCRSRRMGSSGLRELELVKRRLSRDAQGITTTATGVLEDLRKMGEREDDQDEDTRFEDAVEDIEFETVEEVGEDHLSSHPIPRLTSLAPSPPASPAGFGLGLGLGIDFADVEEDMEETFDEVEGGCGLGIDMGEKRESFKHAVEHDFGSSLDETFPDPATPQLSPVLDSVPSLPDIKLPSPRRQVARSPPRAKKPARYSPLPKRVYPRACQLEVQDAVRRIRRKELKDESKAEQSAQEELFYGSPNLSDLPGSFFASPVLPTSFGDFSHSPLPTPPTRFSRVRRSAQQQTAALPLYMPTVSFEPATLPPISTPGPSSTSSAAFLFAPSSPAATPTLVASPTFPVPASPSLAPSSSFAAEDAFPSSAPATPILDQASTFASSGAAATTSKEVPQAMFEAAIASSILGAVAAIGVLGWLAMSLFRRQQKRKDGSSTKQLAIGNGDDEYDEKSMGSTPRLSSLPKVPPVARLSLISQQQTPSSSRQGSPVVQGGRTFSSHFNGWIDVSPLSPTPGATEDYGGYPGEVMRGDGMSTYERRMSVASTMNRRMSTQSGYTVATSKTRETRAERDARRSSYRSSTGPSVESSTWGTRPGTAMSSRTSLHHGGGGGDGFTRSSIDGTAPPRLPETIPPRVSGDASTYFATPPGTPTKLASSSFPSFSALSQHSHHQHYPSSEPPVPTLPAELRDFALPPVPASAPGKVSTRARSGSRSTVGTKGGAKSVSGKAIAASAERVGEGESPTEQASAKLERRRATVDGGIFADGLQALLFQAQLDSPAPLSTSTPTSQQKKDGASDVFASSTPSGSNSKRSSLKCSTMASGASTLSTSPSTITVRKARPQTMPPKIVVSSNHSPLVPTPPAVSTSSLASRKRTSTVDTDILNARASMKTLEELPWLSSSPSTTFRAAAREDAVSVVDPEMHNERTHFSVASKTGPTPTIPARFSKDLSRFVAAGVAVSSASSSKQAALDSIDIASRRLASEDDLASQSSAAAEEDEEEDNAALRSQRRRTLLYSVYKQRGIDLAAVSTPSSTSSATVTPGSTSSASRTTDSEDSSTDSPTKGRQAIVSSFPSPPPVPSPLSFSSFTASQLERRRSTGPIIVDGDSTLRFDPAERDIGTVLPPPEEDDHSPELHISLSPTSASNSAGAPPPRPPKSPVRLSFQAATPSPPPAPLASPRTVVSSGRTSPSRTPFAPISTNLPRPAPSAALPISLPKPIVPAAPLRSFAADLQASVGTPADGYESDALRQSWAFNKPGQSLWNSINHAASDSGSGMLSASSSAYEDLALSVTDSLSAAPSSPAGSTLTGSGLMSGSSSTVTGLYSTSHGSIESLEEAAIAQAETVQFGRGRASGMAQFSWRTRAASALLERQVVEESEESAYEESDVETAWRRKLGTIVQ
ncbi:hypothetical protein JCM8547_004820 [Rhodosporidiobolus lusitaniae]